MESKIEFACTGCKRDLAVAGRVEVRQVEHHAYGAQVTWGTDGKPFVDADANSDSCDDSSSTYAMCGECSTVVELPVEF